MSVRELLDILAGIEETVLQYKAERGRRSARRMISEIDPSQRKLYDLFGLDSYAPKRRVRYYKTGVQIPWLTWKNLSSSLANQESPAS